MDQKVTYRNRGIFYRQYNGETDLQYIMNLVQNELSEPYVIYTYRYFLRGWPNLSFLAFPEGEDNANPSSQPVGVIVCKQSIHKGKAKRGYIAMLSVDREWRKRGIASTLVKLSIEMMTRTGADEVVLETEVDNTASLGLYSSLGFIREKRLFRFYMNGKDAFRLVLPVLPLDPSTCLIDLPITPPVQSVVGGTMTSPLAVSQPMNIDRSGAKGPNVSLNTPPSPLYPMDAREVNFGLGGGAGDVADSPTRSPDILSSTSSSFAMGGLLGAARPRSVDSSGDEEERGNSRTNSYQLYGSHIPKSISPPLPVRPSVARVGPVTRYDDDDDYYTSSR
ncbi:acyl-CoA N-acyltransferase [Serendipita vermifera]|nr:acyl-CoA N-acyltransferase [Serendipita vermifera]